MFCRPLIQRAHVTLHGLKVDSTDQGLQDVIFPWQDVSCVSGRSEARGWYVFTEDGEKYRLSSRPLMLALQAMHEQRVARRVQERSFRQAWQNHELKLVEVVPDGRVSAGMIAIVGAAAFALTAWMLGPPFLHVWLNNLDAPLDPEYRRLAQLLTGLGVVLFALQFLVPSGVFAICFLRDRTSRLRMDTRGIHVDLRAGGESAATWDCLRAAGGRLLTSLTFADGTRMTFGTLSLRARLALHVAEQHLLPEAWAARQVRERRGYRRAGIWCALGGCGIGYITHHLRGEWEAPLVTVGVFVALGIALSFADRLEHLTSWRRPRTRGASDPERHHSQEGIPAA